MPALQERWKDLKEESGKTDIRAICSWLIANYLARYAQEGRQTFCNIFFTDIVQQLKLGGPYHWKIKGEPRRYFPGILKQLGEELSANDIVDWFRAFGHNYGWIKVDKYGAQEFAIKGRLVAICWHSGADERPGHIGVMLKDGSLAQAGKGIPFVGLPIEFGFGELTPEFWAHVED